MKNLDYTSLKKLPNYINPLTDNSHLNNLLEHTTHLRMLSPMV